MKRCLRRDLGVGIAVEVLAFGRELVLQLLEILDDAGGEDVAGVAALRVAIVPDQERADPC